MSEDTQETSSIDVNALKAKVIGQDKEQVATASDQVKADEAVAALTVKEEDRVYQQYTSAKISTCFITPAGKRANFTNYEFYTKDPEIIEYLDEMCETRNTGIKKGNIFAAEEINPAVAAKRDAIKEFLESQAGRDFSSGKLTAEQAMQKAGILSSGQVAR